MRSDTSISHQLRQFVLIIGFIAVNFGGLRLGLKVAEQVVLRSVYGADTVNSQQLRIVDVKPTLKISNGDILDDWSSLHFAISTGVWITASAGLCAIIWKILPGDYRDLAESASTEREQEEASHGVSLLVFILIFLTLFFSCIGAMWVDVLLFS